MPVVAALPFIAAGLSIFSSIKGLSGRDQQQPQVVQQQPVADQAAIDSQSAQEGAAQKLDARRRARSNSLLSSYGGAGDTGAISTTSTSATGKTTLGE